MDYKLASEYRDVALRPEHLEASGLTASEVSEIIEALESVAEPIEITEKRRPLSADPNDDMVLDVAINGDAAVIITANTKHFKSPARAFGITVQTPSEFLTRLRNQETHG